MTFSKAHCLQASTAFGVLLFGFAATAEAQTTAGTVVNLPDVTVSASRGSPLALMDMSTTVITHDEVQDTMARLLRVSSLDPATGYVSLTGQYLEGLQVPAGTTQRWWRTTPQGLFVPRKRTTEEKTSEVNQLWEQLRVIPQPANYLPGISPLLWLESAMVHVPVVRKPGKAVLVLLFQDPDKAVVPFEAGSEWATLKPSTYLLLRERQSAES